MMHSESGSHREHKPADGDQIERLLRLVGPREAVPEIRQERVRSAVRDVWHREVRRRSRRQAAYWTLALAAVLVLALGLPFWQTTSPPAPEVATVERWVSEDTGSETPAFAVGQTLLQGTEVATPSDGQLALRLRSGPTRGG